MKNITKRKQKWKPVKRARRPIQHNGRLFMGVVASVTALSVTATYVWNDMRIMQAAEVEAKESFSGIGQVVAEKSEQDPFVILDVVPGRASYAGETAGHHPYEVDLSLGTIGYLTKTQGVIAEDLAAAYQKKDIDGVPIFYGYDDREALVQAVLPQRAEGSLLAVEYEEGYEGITAGLTPENGWIKVFDSVPETVGIQSTDSMDSAGNTGDADSADATGEPAVPTGKVMAMVEMLDPDDTTADRTGFDYEPTNGTASASMYSMRKSPVETMIYAPDEDGEYRVVFGEAEWGTSGYVAEILSSDIGAYSDATNVYKLVDGKFEYVGQVKDYVEGRIPSTDVGDDLTVGGRPALSTSSTSTQTGSTSSTSTQTGDTSSTSSTSTQTGDTSSTSSTSTQTGDTSSTSSTSTQTGEISSTSSTSTQTGETSSTPSTGTQTGETDPTSSTSTDTSTQTGDTSSAPSTGTQTGGTNPTSGTDTSTQTGETSPTPNTLEQHSNLPDITITGGIASHGWHLLVAADGGIVPVVENNSTPDGVTAAPDNSATASGSSTATSDSSTTTSGSSTATSDSSTTTSDSSTTTSDSSTITSDSSTTTSDSSTTTSDSSTSGDADSDEEDKPPVPVEGDPNAYYVLKFEYAGNLEEPTWVYQPTAYSKLDRENNTIPHTAYTYIMNPMLELSFQATGSGTGNGTGNGTMQTTGSYTYVGAGKGTFKLTAVPKSALSAIKTEPTVTPDSGDAGTDAADAEGTADAESTEGTEDAGQEDIDTISLFASSGITQAEYVEVRNAPVYIRCYQKNDWLKQYVFQSLKGGDNASDSFAIEIQVVPADLLRTEQVLNSDLIYLESGSGDWLGTGEDGSGSGASGITTTYIKPQALEANADMTTDVMFNILYRAVSDMTPVIVDYGIVAEKTNYTDTNYQKLAQILLKNDLSAFFYDMDSRIENMLLNNNLSDTDEHPWKKDNQYNYVNRNVYVVNKTETLVSEDFFLPFTLQEVSAGFREVLAAIKAENTTLPEDEQITETVSKAKAIQYIINYSVGLISDFTDMNILELQPTDNPETDLHRRDDTAKNNTVLYWRKADSGNAGQQIFRSSKRIETEIDTKSLAAFVGEQADINGTYQMIFIGLDAQQLNNDRKGTVYNDAERNGKVYTRSGDLANDSGERYAGIDLTPSKREALVDYMRAGYPIVVEDDFFRNKTAKDAGEYDINTDYIDSDTEMYAFLKKAVEDYGDNIYTITDVHSSAMFAAQVNVRRPSIDYQDADTPSVTTLVREEDDDAYIGTINYRVSDGRGEEYQSDVSLRLYFDWNDDGRFAEDEETGDFVADNGTLTVSFQTKEKGIIPWKLEVCDSGNDYRRDSMTGFFILSSDGRPAIPVLQVVADGTDVTDASVNLQTAYRTENAMLGYFLRSAEDLIGADYQFKTITAAKLSEELAGNENYLNGWDVLVLGFGDPYQLGESAGAVSDYIAAGKSVLLSANSAVYDGLGIENTVLGLEDEKTYYSLAKSKGGQSYYYYKSIKSEMLSAMSFLQLEKANDGIVSHYPYEIADTPLIARQTEAADYRLDLSGNGGEDQISDVTAWYTFGSSRNMAAEVTAYDLSARDAANNYYIYSKSNIMYVGQNSYPFSYDPAAELVPEGEGAVECQLFVNALMGAYHAGVKNPQVAIVAGFASDAPQVESICIPFDTQIRDAGEGAGLLDETVDVYFRVADNNLFLPKEVKVSFYYEDEAGGEVDIGGETVHATGFATQVWAVEENQLIEVPAGSLLTPGQIYRIKAPVVALKDSQTNAAIYVVAEAHFRQLGEERAIRGGDRVYLNRSQLFLLE